MRTVRRPRRRLAALIGSALVCCAAIAAAAQAQDDPVGDVQDQAEQVEQVRQAEATAQDPGPGCVEQTQIVASEGATGCDTEYTPIAKDGQELGWLMVSGKVFSDPETGKPVNSGDYEPAGEDGVPGTDDDQNQTDPTADLYTVDFISDFNGLAGGAVCQTPPPNEASFDAHVETCTRVPIVYRYQLDERGVATWKEVFRGTSPGYVGAITWLTRDSALAVGGTGCYPRREDRTSLEETGRCPDGNPGTEADPIAGEGRAWYSSDVRGRGSFSPASFGDFPADEATGMTAADSTYGLAEARLTTECRASRECAFAGGLKQIWMWKDGDFVDDPYEPTDDVRNGGHSESNDPDPVEGSGNNVQAQDIWHYRVRALRFRPAPGDGADAATSGCCKPDATGRPDPTERRPSTLVFKGQAQSWTVSRLKAFSGSLGADQTHDAAYAANNGKLFPESIYSISPTTGSIHGALFTPGGPEEKVEAGSYIGNSKGPIGSLDLGLILDEKASNGGMMAGPTVSAVRLVAGGEDLLTHQANFCQVASGDTNYGSPQGQNTCGGDRKDPDGLIDWAVGELRTTRQALAYTTTQRSYMGPYAEAVPFPLDCPEGGLFGNLKQSRVPLECTPKNDPTAELKSATLYRLPSYSLNGFVSVTTTGASWAVGDRGAIMRLGGEAAAATFPPETRPPLGARREAPAPDRGPFEAKSPPLTDEPGTVPSLAARPMRESAPPQLVSYGVPEPNRPAAVKSIAMSRDGSEGWAVGPPPLQTEVARTTLYRFEGGRWTSCRFHRTQVLDPDPACAALKPLREFNRDGVRIMAISRIPLEYDRYPTNDDEFEAIAVATPAEEVTGIDSVTVLRYSEGKWGIDWEATQARAGPNSTPLLGDLEVTDIAFSGPDDGWMLGSDGFRPELWRWDGEEWAPCFEVKGDAGGSPFRQVNPERCEDSTPDADDDPETGHQGIFPFPGWVNALHLTSAGDRVYFYGTRADPPVAGSTGEGSGTPYPVILYNNSGRCDAEDQTGCWKTALDPKNDVGGDSEDPATQGILHSLSVARGPDDTYTGWAGGAFGSASDPKVSGARGKLADRDRETAILRSEADGTTWAPFDVEGPARDYLLPPTPLENGTSYTLVPEVVALPGLNGEGAAVAVPQPTGLPRSLPIVRFDPAKERWEVFPTPWTQEGTLGSTFQGRVDVISPDNAGGLWLAARPRHSASGTGSYFYRYTPQVPESIFTEAPHPIRERITATAGGSDGSFWVATNSPTVYRYDRVTGWDRTTVPGWDPGRVVTVSSEANAVAVGPGGEGVLVGRGGRIADIGPDGVALDGAAGVLCSQGNEPPCGTGRDLHAAAVASDGSALVGGEYLSLLYRPPGGEFDAISPPSSPAAAFAQITDISMPSPERAWLTLDTGYVFAGTLEGGNWRWQVEAVDDFGDTISRSSDDRVQRLRSIAIDSSGHGYAVGDSGVILEREDGEWRLLDYGYLDHLVSVTLAPGGEGALIGGGFGLILTGDGDHFKTARPSELFDPLALSASAARIVGVALVPGTRPGEVEAWAASQNPHTTVYRRPEPGGILHYSSDPADPLLDGGIETSEGLSDSASRSPDELAFAAFGRSECQTPQGGANLCPELLGSDLANDVVARSVRDAILGAGKGALDFGVLTGDVGDAGGSSRKEFVDAGVDPSWIHERWAELIGGPLVEGGVPIFGSIGARDLSRAEVCEPLFLDGCVSGPEDAAGPNFGWRQAMAQMPSPWGAPESTEDASSASGQEFMEVDAGGVAVELEDQTVADPTEAVGDVTVPTGGARTHYAFDVEQDGESLLRVAVVDTSLRSLAASDALQNPAQEQLGWLREVLCVKGQPTGAASECTRQPGQRAIVVSNTPTYSYGPGVGTDTQTDAAAFEQVLMENDVDLVVSGRLGWNGVYWTCAPGLHYPSPGSTHPDPNRPPKDTSQCAAAASEIPDPSASVPASGELSSDPLPVVIASSAGGKFGPGDDLFGSSPAANGTAAEGYWRGYTTIRIDPHSNAPPIIEQRPVFDWMGMTADTHTLLAGERTKLKSYAREPAGIDVPFRYFSIDSPAITHRYDLLLADQEKPWLPCMASDDSCVALHSKLAAGPSATAGTNNCAPYLCLPARIGSIDDQTGAIGAGNGKYPDTFAIAMLSVGERVATFPIAFTKSPSFVVQPLTLTPQTPQLPTTDTSAPSPPNPPNPPQPNVPQPNVPEILAPPPVPPIAAASPPEPQPPVPPAPPPPTEQPSPLNLALAPPAMTIATPTAVIQPPTPPVNPAPPGGARREARQRQAAAQKSGADNEETGSEQQDLGGDLAQSGPDRAMTRRERTRPEPSFTAIARAEQPSAWAQGALYTGGIALVAFGLAAGWSRGRPTPRQRPPEVPSPAYARARRRVE